MTLALRTSWFVLSSLLLAAGCAPPARFADRAILWRDLDDDPSPKPRGNYAYSDWVGLRDAVLSPLDRALGLDYGDEAENVNAVDEVPDSTWYMDRRRVLEPDGRVWWRHYDPGTLEAGPLGGDPPPTPPFVVTRGKTEGLNAGFQIRDANGTKWLLKFDHPAFIGLDTSTEAVTTRLVWAAGWNVPAETLVEVRPEDFSLGRGATRKGRYGETIPFYQEDLDKVMRRIPRQRDGTMRAIASRWLPGDALGPFNYLGHREDDFNDRVPHEDRRDLRGFGVVSAWINNTDALETNTLDTYVGKPNFGHVLHWQQDVGGAFGARATGPIPYWMGGDTYLPVPHMLASLLTLGIYRATWEGDEVRLGRGKMLAEFPEIGFFDVEHFEPKRWTPVLDNPAFVRQTARDRLWGAKRVLQFSEAEVRDAVRAGRYRRVAEDRLVNVLMGRRQAIARAFFTQLSPLDGFHFRGNELCFDDLWVEAELGGAETTRYWATGAAAGMVRPVGPYTRCAALVPGHGYRVALLAVARAGDRHIATPVKVHFIEDGATRRLIGLERD